VTHVARPWRAYNETTTPLYLTVEAQQEVKTATVTVVGECDLATAPEFRRRLDEVLTSPIEVVRLDLEGLGFLDSSGLAALDSVRSAADARGIRLVLASLPAQTRQVLELTDMLRLFTVESTVAPSPDSAVPDPA
jgi:anti-sigma B factor antagonist